MSDTDTTAKPDLQAKKEEFMEQLDAAETEEHIWRWVRYLANEMYEQGRAEVQSDIKSVLGMLEGDTDRKKIANYIREYML